MYLFIKLFYRGCKKVKPVSNVAKGIRKRSELKSLITQADKTQSKLKSLHDKQENNIKMLDKVRGEILSKFRNMRKKLKRIVYKLEEDSTRELERLIALIKEHIISDKEACYDSIDKFQKLLGDVQTLGKECDELAFQGYVKCSKQMAYDDKLFSSIQNVQYDLQFTPDEKIEQYLTSLKTLGSFQLNAGCCLDRLKINEVAQIMTQPDHV